MLKRTTLVSKRLTKIHHQKMSDNASAKLLRKWRADLGLNITLGVIQILAHSIGLYLLLTIKRKQVNVATDTFAFINTLLIGLLSFFTIIIDWGGQYNCPSDTLVRR